MILAGSYSPPPMLMRASDGPATLAIEDRGMPAILAACADPANTLETIYADMFGRTFHEPSN